MRGYRVRWFLVLAFVAAWMMLFGRECTGQTFYKECIGNNYHGAWHAAGGAIITSTLYINGNKHSVTITLGVAIGWEILEYLLTDINSIYGSRNAFITDAVGDITLAMTSGIVTYLTLNIVERIRR